MRFVLEILDDIRLPIEPHPYTLEETLNMLNKGNPLIVDALEEGKVLYSTKELDTLVNRYNQLKMKGLTRTNTTIIIPPE